MEKKLFRYKKIFVPQFLSGVFLSYSALDNILEGPLRKLSKQYFDLGEFGSNAREESLYFIILFFGIFQIVISLQNLFQPVIEVKNGKIAIKTKQKILSVIKPINEIIEITESDDFTLTFVFQDSSYDVISKYLENNELNLILSEIRGENSPKSSRKIH